MLAVLFLLISMFTGFALVMALVPRVMQRKIMTVAGERARNPLFAMFPACFLSGTALVTWLTYIVGCALQNTAHPLGYANAIVMPVMVVGSTVVILALRRRVHGKELVKSLRPTTSEMLYFAASLAVSVVLMIASFRVLHGDICLPAPIVEDFALHVNMIRSFSVWEKLPAQFPYFTNAGINYHFMMDFLAGNLEFLGLRIDFAYNVPSVLAMTAFFCGVYECFFRLCGRKNYCHVVWLLVMFRSSWGIVSFVRENWGNLREAFKTNETYMGKTVNEWWGIYQPNALINQRHLIFGYAVAMFVISLFLPYLIVGIKERRELRAKKLGRSAYLREVFLKEAMPAKRSVWLTAVFAGLVLGMCGLFSAHSVIAALLFLFVIAWFSANQFAFILTAVIAGALAFTETKLCTGSMGQFQIRFVKAWALEETSLSAIVTHMWLLLGLMIPLLVIWFIRTDSVRRIVMIASAVPFVFGFHVLMTPEPMQNHKYMLFSIYWFGLQGGIALCSMMSAGKKQITRIACLLAALVMILPLTATGMYDFYLVLDKCKSDKAYRYEVHPPLLDWAKDNRITRDTIFLGPDNFISMMNTAGFQNYFGYYGFVHNAGYDAAEREEIMNSLIHAKTERNLWEAIGRCDANYLVLQHRIRSNDARLNEALIASVCEKVYSRYDDEWEFCIYRLKTTEN